LIFLFCRRALGAARLFLPALFPAWRFFDLIGPAPRIEVQMLADADDDDAPWVEFRPRPERLTVAAVLGRLFWNPWWNDTLYLANCAERQIRDPAPQAERAIRSRIVGDLHNPAALSGPARFFRYRLVFLGRVQGEVAQVVAHVSPILEFRDPGSA